MGCSRNVVEADEREGETCQAVQCFLSESGSMIIIVQPPCLVCQPSTMDESEQSIPVFDVLSVHE